MSIYRIDNIDSVRHIRIAFEVNRLVTVSTNKQDDIYSGDINKVISSLKLFRGLDSIHIASGYIDGSEIIERILSSIDVSKLSKIKIVSLKDISISFDVLRDMSEDVSIYLKRINIDLVRLGKYRINKLILVDLDISDLNVLSWDGIKQLQISRCSCKNRLDISKLSSLTVLKISKCMFDSVPNFNNCSNLEIIYIKYTDLSNDTINYIDFKNMPELKDIYIYGCNITGQLPESIGSLEKLQYLDLSYNQIEGEIPATYGDFKSIENIVLCYNMLEGDILPFENLYDCETMHVLMLNNNKLNGDITVDICDIPNIENLIFDHNNFNKLEDYESKKNIQICIDSKLKRTGKYWRKKSNNKNLYNDWYDMTDGAIICGNIVPKKFK